MDKLVTIYGLCYGNYPDMHGRFARSLGKYVPKTEARIVLWLNEVSSASVHMIDQPLLDHEITMVHSAQNRPKYEVMRELFHYPDYAPKTPWIMWMDDDSYISSHDWWSRTTGYIDAHPDACYMGQPWYVHHLPGQWDFIKKAEWYKGLPPEQCPTKTKNVTKPGINFAQGAYWWLRTDIMKQLDWPDPRLSHNGGDTLLGEAIRQQGLPFHKFHHGVSINKAKRRGLSERPAGSSKDTRR